MDYAPAARGRFDRAAAGLLEREREFPPLEEIPEIVRGKSFTVVNGAFLGSEQDGADLLRPLRELGPQMDTLRDGAAGRPVRDAHGPDRAGPVQEVGRYLNCLVRHGPVEVVKRSIDAAGRPRPLLVAVPNVSEGRDRAVLEALEASVGPARVLDLHVDPDHNRAVYTLAAPQGELAAGLLGLARAAAERIDLTRHDGVHPHVGALDVMPVVWLDEGRRGAACAEALTAAALVGEEVGLPVFLYGELATRPEHAERAWLRRGGPAELARRMEAGEVVPDYGPPRAHPSAGATLATARPPLLAFNLDLASDDVELARSIAAGLRESGGGPPGVRALGLYLPARGRAQVSTNVHDHRAVPLADIVERVRARAPVAEAELIGLAPRAAFEGFPEDVPLRGFSPERHILEEALAALE